MTYSVNMSQIPLAYYYNKPYLYSAYYEPVISKTLS